MNGEQRIWTVEDHLAGQPLESVALYHRFVELLSEIGPFEYSVSKTTITFKGTRRGFAGARPTKGGLRGYLDLQHPIADPRVLNSAPYTKRLFVNHFRIAEYDEMDTVFRGWMSEAYAVGGGAHVDSVPADAGRVITSSTRGSR